MSEFKALRDEIAKIVAENKRKDAALQEQLDTIGQLRATVEHVSLENQRLRQELARQGRHMSYYENPHSPPSQDSIPARQKRAARRKDPGSHRKPGRSAGHNGTSHGRRSEYTVRHRADRCERCGCTDMDQSKITSKQMTDIDFIPRVRTSTDVLHHSACKRCGHVSIPKGRGIRGTGIGPNLSALAVSLWENNASESGIRSVLRVFGLAVSRATVQHAIHAVSRRLEPVHRGIRHRISESAYLKADETPYRIGGGNGYVWTVVGDESVLIHAAPTRGGIVLDSLVPDSTIPITCDGYAPYGRFQTRQRCWAHILREARDASSSPERAVLHERLQRTFRKAKAMQVTGCRQAADTGPLTGDVLAVAARYKSLGCSFGEKLENAAPHLFTFVSRPGMEPTNNESERMLRPVVISRKIRYHMGSTSGMRAFSVIKTCMLTWRKRGQNVSEMLLEALVGT